MRKIIIYLLTFFSTIITVAQVPNPEVGDKSISPIVVESAKNERVYLSEWDDRYLNKISSRWADLLNQTLLYNNYSVSDSVNINRSVDTFILKQRLEKLNEKTPLDIAYNDVVQAYINRFLKMGSWLGKVMGLAEYYFPVFEDKLSKYDIPIEIKYLAIIESALNPRAGSNRGAIGLWQFIYSTAKLYGLKIDSYVDERMDPLKSTEAACQYFERHYKIYGDWNLVLAAYNSGEGNVNKAIRRSGGYKNYWNIRRYLPQETQTYVPSFIAMTYLFEYAKEHHLKPLRLDVSLYDTDTVWIKKKLSFQQISSFTGVSLPKIKFLNPQYKNDIIPRGQDKQYILRLPRKNIENFVSLEDSIYLATGKVEAKNEKPFAISNKGSAGAFKIEKIKATYQVKKNETIDSIAKVYNVSPSDIRKWNKLSDSAAITTGQQLTIFHSVKKYNVSRYIKSSKTTRKKYYHTVRRGESLYSIAKKYHVYTRDIKRWNHLKSSKLKYGSRLVIYSRSSTGSSRNSKSKTHIVRRGESLSSISKKYHVSVSNIKNWNRLKSNLLKVGQKILLYNNASSKKSSSNSYHTVRKGESLSSISKKYHVSVSNIKNWNRLKSNLLKVGQKILLYNNVSSKKSSSNSYHTVRKGESLSSIAKKYRVSISNIKKWNRLPSNVIRVGKKLLIKK